MARSTLQCILLLLIWAERSEGSRRKRKVDCQIKNPILTAFGRKLFCNNKNRDYQMDPLYKNSNYSHKKDKNTKTSVEKLLNYTDKTLKDVHDNIGFIDMAMVEELQSYKVTEEPRNLQKERAKEKKRKNAEHGADYSGHDCACLSNSLFTNKGKSDICKCDRDGSDYSMQDEGKMSKISK